MTAKDFILNIPKKLKGDELDGDNAIIHFDIEEEGGGEFTVQITDGNCQVLEGLAGDPDCVVKAKNKHFVKVVTGETKPVMAFMTGQIKVSNTGVLLQYAKLLGF